MKMLKQSLIGLSLLLPLACIAKSYPEQPIRLIVPYAAGGGTDIAARMVAQELSPRLEQTIIVENKAGAATQIGTTQVVRAKPDGYTLLMGTANLATNTAFYDNLPYSVSRDLTAVIQITDVPVYIFVSTDSPIKDFASLIVAAKKGESLTYATAGVGSIPHLAGEIFSREAKLNISHVPYKGSSEAVIALISGQVAFSVDNLPPAYGQVKAGRIKPLAIAAKKRSLTFPDIPTLEELGYPVEASSWWGVMAPAGTPEKIITKLNTEIGAVIAEPKVRNYFIEQGMNPVGGSPQQFTQHIATETSKWQKTVKDADIKIGN